VYLKVLEKKRNFINSSVIASLVLWDGLGLEWSGLVNITGCVGLLSALLYVRVHVKVTNHSGVSHIASRSKVMTSGAQHRAAGSKWREWATVTIDSL